MVNNDENKNIQKRDKISIFEKNIKKTNGVSSPSFEDEVVL